MYILDNVFLVMKDIVVENVPAFFGSVKVTGHYGKSANTYEINKPYLKYIYTGLYSIYIHIPCFPLCHVCLDFIWQYIGRLTTGDANGTIASGSVLRKSLKKIEYHIFTFFYRK